MVIAPDCHSGGPGSNLCPGKEKDPPTPPPTTPSMKKLTNIHSVNCQYGIHLAILKSNQL